MWLDTRGLGVGLGSGSSTKSGVDLGTHSGLERKTEPGVGLG